MGERGLFMGFFALCVTNGTNQLFYYRTKRGYLTLTLTPSTPGPHIAPIAGGFIAQTLSWRWCLYVPAIVMAGLWVVLVFTFPETLFLHEDPSNKLESRRSYISRLIPRGKVCHRSMSPRDFLTPFRMIKYWAVTLPCIYYCTANTYGSALFAVTGSHLSETLYDFNTAQTGLLMGVPLTIGCMIGEASAGWLSDSIINAYARRYNGYRKPEARLYLLPLCLFLNVGTIVYGICVQGHKPWIALALCMGVAGVGLQVGTTVVYTYCTDSYKPQAAEIGAVINLFRQGEFFFFTWHSRFASLTRPCQYLRSILDSMLYPLGKRPVTTSALACLAVSTGSLWSLSSCSSLWASGSASDREFLKSIKTCRIVGGLD
jgi:MFS family permease